MTTVNWRILTAAVMLMAFVGSWPSPERRVVAQEEERKTGQTFEATVDFVFGGDQLDVLDNGRKVSIRVSGVKCPEPMPGDSFWVEPMNFTKRAASVGTQVKLIARYRDGGRLVCEVMLPSGASLGELLVRNGWGEHRTKDTQGDKDASDLFAALQNFARAKKLGIWTWKK